LCLMVFLSLFRFPCSRGEVGIDFEKKNDFLTTFLVH
jgi:hypothetical protein